MRFRLAATCGTHWITLRRDISTFVFLRSFPARCNSWNCTPCAMKKSLKYGTRISSAFKNEQLYFYTLTFYHSTDAETAWSGAARAWNLFNISIHKKYGAWRYVRILETHKKTCYPHYHVLSPLYILPSQFASIALGAGFGYQLRTQRVSSSGVSGYLRKYLGKTWPRADAAKLRTRLRLRVFTSSQNLPWPKTQPSGWRLHRFCATRDEAISSINECRNSYFHFGIDFDWEPPPEGAFEFAFYTHPPGMAMCNPAPVGPVSPICKNTTCKHIDNVVYYDIQTELFTH